MNGGIIGQTEFFVRAVSAAWPPLISFAAVSIAWPPLISFAAVAQLAERLLPKQKVGSSKLLRRSEALFYYSYTRLGFGKI